MIQEDESGQNGSKQAGEKVKDWLSRWHRRDVEDVFRQNLKCLQVRYLLLERRVRVHRLIRLLLVFL